MVIDVCDVSDLSNSKKREPVISEKKSLNNWIANITRHGGIPILIYGPQCNAIGQMVGEIEGRVGYLEGLRLLRIHGHAAPANQGIGGGLWHDRQMELSDLALGRKKQAGKTLSELKPYFMSSGSVELHGCDVAHGKEGRKLVIWLAKTFNVPVSAGLKYQYDEYAEDIYKLDGPVLIAYPNGRIQKTSWRNVPGAYCGFN